MATLQTLLRRQIVWRGDAPSADSGRSVPTGFAVLDRELPGGGWPAGALTEILAAAEGIGELRCVLPALAALTADGRGIAWVRPPYQPYAPALAASGVRLGRLIVIQANARRDALWAIEQVLRAGVCHALLAWLPSADYPELRRLAVAAEASPGFTVLFRSPRAGTESSPSRLRLALEAQDGQLFARILKRRGTPSFVPLGIPVRTPYRALGRISLPWPASRSPASRLRTEPVA